MKTPKGRVITCIKMIIVASLSCDLFHISRCIAKSSKQRSYDSPPSFKIFVRYTKAVSKVHRVKYNSDTELNSSHMKNENSQILEIVQKENRLYVQVLCYNFVYHTYTEKFCTLMRAEKLCLIDRIHCKMPHNCKDHHIIKNVSIYK